MTRVAAGWAAALWMTISGAAFGGEAYTPTIDQLIPDLMKSDPDPNVIVQVWWIPAEFWRSVAVNNPNLPPQTAEEMVTLMTPYTVIAASSGRLGVMGAATFDPPASVRASTRLRLSNGTVLSPLAPAELPADVAMLPTIMGPIFANMLGPMGESFEFMVFKNSGPNGARLIQPTATGAFTVTVGGTTVNWALPLESLVPPTTCHACSRELKGTWKFCPYDGTPVTR